MCALPAHRRRTLPSCAVTLPPPSRTIPSARMNDCGRIPVLRAMRLVPFASAPAQAVVIAVMLLALCVPVRAEIVFRGPSSLFPTGPTPFSVAIADLDGDGKADLVVTNGAVYSDARVSSISILRGRGDGTFEPRRDIVAGHVPQRVIVADLNKDDRLDLAIANYGDSPNFAGSVTVLLGHGDGTFEPPVDHVTGGRQTRNVTAADLDADGDLDLVTEDALLPGYGDGTFGAATYFGTTGDWFVAVADLDRDGHLDHVASNEYADGYDAEEGTPAFTVRLGNGDGTFREPMPQGIGYGCLALAISDFDGDGWLDLAVCNVGWSERYWSGVSIFRGLGDGRFGPGRFYPTGVDPESIVAADVDGDGKLDLATANFGADPDTPGNSLSILLGNGDGTFRRIADVQTGENPVCVAAGRLDANATTDLVAVNLMGNSVSVFTGNGDGTFGNPDVALGRNPSGLATGDFDRDGRADLVASHWSSIYTGPGGGSVVLGRGDGRFGGRIDLALNGGLGSVTAGDLNGDGRSDLAFTGESGMSVMLADGDATFGPPLQVTSDFVPGRPVLADFDRDGRMDAAIPLDYGANAVSVLLGRGDGTFGPSTRFATGNIPYSAASGDLNGDGNPDLVVGLSGFKVSVLLGRGDGSFDPHVVYPSGNFFANRAPVGLGDFDEDGDLDVVNGNLLLRGNGDGTLQAGTRYDVRFGEEGIHIEDLDGDHHLDLVVLNSSADIVSIHPGRGDGTFGARLDHPTGGFPRAMVAADFDGDHRTDLAVANYSPASISILLNRSQAPVIPVAFELRPGILGLRAGARWITGVLRPGAPYSAADVDVASIRLNGVVQVDRALPGAPGRGSTELVLRIDRAALAATLPAGDRALVTITGTIGRDRFQGTTTVRVLGRGGFGTPDVHALAIRVLASDPRTNGLHFGITLAEDGPARVDVIDVAGRSVVSRELASLEAGPHDIHLASGVALSPGIYFVRLRQGGHVAHSRTAVLR